MISTNRAGQPWVKPANDTDLLNVIEKCAGSSVMSCRTHFVAARSARQTFSGVAGICT